MDTIKHHDSNASNQQQDDDESLLPADDPVLQQFLAHFDPLARLEAEYAAVLAQSSASSFSAAIKSGAEDASSNDNQKHGDDDEHEDEDDGDEDDEYARVPMSPTSDDGAGGGECYQPLGDASDSDDDGADDSDDNGECVAARATGDGLEAPAPVAKMDAAKREMIMKSMQGLQLAPPPWSKSAELSDDELFAMVRDHLER